MTVVMNILSASFEMFKEASPYMLFGFFCAGILQAFVKSEQIVKYLGKGKIRSVLIAALAGIPIPLCSCGVVPAAAGLKKQGANNGATLSFLISTPETGVDSIPITYALIDPVMAAIRPVAAFVIAAIAGITQNFFDDSTDKKLQLKPFGTGGSSCSCNGSCNSRPAATNLSLTRRLISGMKYAFVELLGDIGKWFLLGIILAGIISTLIPDQWMNDSQGSGIVSMLMMLIIGIPLYICATSSTPIAAALILKGMSPGAALVFLIAGPATNITSMSMVSGLLGRKALVIYLMSVIIGALGFGFLTDWIYAFFDLSAKAQIGHTTEFFPAYIEWVSAAILAGLLMYNTVIRFQENQKKDATKKTENNAENSACTIERLQVM